MLTRATVFALCGKSCAISYRLKSGLVRANRGSRHPKGILPHQAAPETRRTHLNSQRPRPGTAARALAGGFRRGAFVMANLASWGVRLSLLAALCVAFAPSLAQAQARDDTPKGTDEV